MGSWVWKIVILYEIFMINLWGHHCLHKIWWNNSKLTNYRSQNLSSSKKGIKKHPQSRYSFKVCKFNFNFKLAKHRSSLHTPKKYPKRHSQIYLSPAPTRTWYKPKNSPIPKTNIKIFSLRNSKHHNKTKIHHTHLSHQIPKNHLKSQNSKVKTEMSKSTLKTSKTSKISKISKIPLPLNLPHNL